MKSRNRLILLGMLGGSVFTGVTEKATSQQEPTQERGFSAETAFQVGAFDHVNLFNGNLVLTIPLGEDYPAGGSLSYRLVLSYNSKVWDWETQDSSDPGIGNQGGTDHVARLLPHQNAGVGWSINLGRIESATTNPPTMNPEGRTTYVGPDGGCHSFYRNLHRNDPIHDGYSYSRDGSYLRLQETAAGWSLEFPSGERHDFDSDGRLIRVEDRFMNHVTVDYSNPLYWEISDTFDRIHRVWFERSYFMDGESVPLLTKVELAAFAGGTAEYALTYEQGALDRPCLHDSPIVPVGTHAAFLTSITLPDGSSFTAALDDYHRLADDEAMAENLSCHARGTLRQLTLPTGGAIGWRYGVYRFPTGNTLPDQEVRPAFYQRTPGVVERTVMDRNGNELGRWSYTPSVLLVDDEEPLEMKNTVIDPLGHRRVHYFSAYLGGLTKSDADAYFYGQPFTQGQEPDDEGRFLSQEIFDGATSQLVRSVWVKYERDENLPISVVSGGPVITDLNQRLVEQATVFHDADSDSSTPQIEPTVSVVKLSHFDGLGHFRRSRTEGNYSKGNVRVNHTEYDAVEGIYHYDHLANALESNITMLDPSDEWLLNTYSESWAQEEGRIAKREHYFDDTGFLVRERIYRNFGESRSEHDVIHHFTRDSAGQVMTALEFGGDLASVPLSGELENLELDESDSQVWIEQRFDSGSLKTSFFKYPGGEALPFLNVDRDIDSSTGLTSATRDASGLQTDLAFDELGRLVRIEPENGEGAIIEYIYHPATSAQLASIDIYQWDNPRPPSGDPLTEGEVVLDDFGRTYEERDLFPGDTWSIRRMLYDALGQRVSVTERSDVPTHRTTFHNYDPFGRARRIVPPENGDLPVGVDHAIEFQYLGDRFVERTVSIGTNWVNGSLRESRVTTTEEYDRQGRLYKVTEPGGIGVEAEYHYDVGDRLTRVIARGGNNQNRYFEYDARGFLVSEEHPESGRTEFSQFNTSGQPGRRKLGVTVSNPNGQWDLTYVYDRAQRLTQIREGQAGRSWKEFHYTDRKDWGWSRGKLRSAVRHNWIEIPWNPGEFIDVPITETFDYEGRGGAISRRETSTFFEIAFSQHWQYSALGDVIGLDYPRCIHESCESQATAGPSRHVSFDYERGVLTGVPGYASSIEYHPNGVVHRIQHANEGVTDTWARDPYDRPRVQNIRAEGISVGDQELGVHRYDGVGNVVARGPEQYFYDAVGRIRSFELNGVTETYGYNRHGNLITVTRSEAGQMTSARTIGVSPSTNRINSLHDGSTLTADYDSVGNMTRLGSESFRYDPFNMIHSYSYPEETYLYTPDDHRVLTARWDGVQSVETWTLRDLDGSVLSAIENIGGEAGTWTWKQDYVYRDRQLLASETPEAGSAGTLHYHLDHLGTPRLTTDLDHQIVHSQHYFPFGESQVEGGAGDQEAIGFTGHELDVHAAGSNLNYMLARYYHPELGRFLSVDPIHSANVGVPQSWNKYSYARNNPVLYTDPNGEDISVKVHHVRIGNYHTSILIVPSNQSRYEEDPRFRKSDKGQFYATIGAGPSSLMFGNLVSGVNRKNDADLSNAKEVLPIDLGTKDEDAVIAELFEAEQNFEKNVSEKSHDYDAFPAPEGERKARRADDSHNSNSFTRGLLEALGLTPPQPKSKVPGYNVPVPPKMFRPPKSPER